MNFWQRCRSGGDTDTREVKLTSSTEGRNVEFKQVVGNRRSIRYYKPYQPVEKDKIQTILEAARLQCQHGNAGLVRKAVVVTKGETDDAIRE